MKKLVQFCPSCGDRLKIAVLVCPSCGIEVRGEFDIETGTYSALSDQQSNFLLLFLKCRGNMKHLQEELHLSYPAAKKQLNDLLDVLGLSTDTQVKVKDRDIIDVTSWNVDENSMKTSDIIKRKLKECSGRTVVTSYSGKEYEIWAEPDGSTFGCDALHGIALSFEIFDVVVDFLRNNGGKAKKGTGRVPLGSEKCGLDTISGVILHEYFGVAPGGSGFDPSFAVAAILEWAGIVKNGRGWLELRD